MSINNVIKQNGQPNWEYMENAFNAHESQISQNSQNIDANKTDISNISMIQQTVVPNNYMISKGICIDDAVVASDWLLPVNGVYNARRVSDKKLLESGAILFDVVPNVWTAITKAIDYDFTNVSTIAFAIYIEDERALNYIQIRLTTDSTKANNVNNWSTYFDSGQKFTATKLQSGWNLVKMSKSDFTNVGGETWGNFKAIRIVFGVPSTKYNNGFTGNTLETVTKTTVGVGGIYLNPIHKIPKIMLNFDDSMCYAGIYPYMRSKGIRGTIYLCYDHTYEVGAGKYMTEAQHNEVYNAGWDIGCHSKTHTDMWYLDKDQLLWEWSTVLDYVLSKGWTRGAYFAAYPKAEYNTLEMEVIQSLGFKMARGRSLGLIDYMTSDQMLGYPTYEIQSTTTLSSVTGWIDKAIERGTDMSLFTHYITDTTPPDSYGTTTTIFKSVVDYLVSKRDAGLLELVTASEYYAGLSNKTITIPNIITGAN